MKFKDYVYLVVIYALVLIILQYPFTLMWKLLIK